MDEKDIENLEDIKGRLKTLVDSALKMLEAELKVDDGMRKCPSCHKEFDPVEIGIEAKSLPPAVSEHLQKGLMDILLGIEVRPKDDHEKLEQDLARAMKGWDALKKIRRIMEAFKTVYQDKKTAGDISVLMFNALSDIDKAILSLQKG